NCLFQACLQAAGGANQSSFKVYAMGSGINQEQQREGYYFGIAHRYSHEQWNQWKIHRRTNRRL
ncbi:MAG: hypothetical protein O6934_11975, partial [SAR324 cluster bacterium]|nr:hypothetical protein [SAR324 cluster bacterium]